MAWHYGTYKCGHDGKVNIVGPVKDRQWKEDRHFSKLCPDCWEEHLAEERERMNAEAAAKAKEMGLPELTGSEKQISWANTIRQDMLGKLERREMLGLFLRTGRVTEENIETAISGLRMETSSRWFIDHRDDDSLEIVAAIVPEVQA